MNKPALITGASAGIGKEIALEAARRGYDLILTARSADRLESLAQDIRVAHGREVLVLPMDLSDPETPERLFQTIKRKKILPELLVNNAGFGTGGAFARSNLEREEQMILVNVLALMKLTRLFLQSMLESGRGHILNVGSTAGFLPGPYMANYYATKAYVLQFSEALSEELRGTGVSCSVLCPGATRTDFFEVAGVASAAIASGGLLPMMEAAEVARSALDGINKNRTVILPGINRFLPGLLRFSPRFLIRRIAGSINRKREGEAP